MDGKAETYMLLIVLPEVLWLVAHRSQFQNLICLTPAFVALSHFLRAGFPEILSLKWCIEKMSKFSLKPYITILCE